MIRQKIKNFIWELFSNYVKIAIAEFFIELAMEEYRKETGTRKKKKKDKTAREKASGNSLLSAEQ